eukprot:m.265400 g.265400  ORF g.265400 m.265400 type:complete len:341 (-) comp61665_c0_seq1:118-1140(-)
MFDNGCKMVLHVQNVFPVFSLLLLLSCTHSHSALTVPVVTKHATPRRDVVMLSAYFGSSTQLLEVTKPNKLAYANKHRIRFVDAMQDSAKLQNMINAVTDNLGAAAEDQSSAYNALLFLKLPILLHYAEKWQHQYKWIFWTDADSIFFNFSKSLTAVLDDVPVQTHLVVPAGPSSNPKWVGVLNTGHFFIRTSPMARALLRAVFRHSRQPCDPSIPLFNNWINLCPKVCCEWGEQGALMQVLQMHPKFMTHVKYRGFRDFGSHFPFYGEGDLIVHLPGLKLQERLQVFAAFLKGVNFTTGKFITALPQAFQPVYNRDHLPNMDYSTENKQFKNNSIYKPV